VTIYATDKEIRSEMVRSLHRWWLSRHASDIPDRADLDPTDLKRLLPNLFIADVEHDPFRIRYRLVGTKAIEATGFDLTGRYLDDLLPANIDDPWMDFYHRAYRTRSPVFGEINAPTTTGGRFIYEFGLFPLRKGGLSVDQFVAIEDYFNLTSTLVDLIEWRELGRCNELPGRQTFSLSHTHVT
jgi:hypothetical protein